MLIFIRRLASLLPSCIALNGKTEEAHKSLVYTPFHPNLSTTQATLVVGPEHQFRQEICDDIVKDLNGGKGREDHREAGVVLNDAEHCKENVCTRNKKATWEKMRRKKGRGEQEKKMGRSRIFDV